MRSIIDGSRIQDSKVVQGLFWATPFQNISGNFSLPDDPEVSYAFLATGAATRNIILPRIIGNTAFGGPAGLLSGTHVLDGLYLELLNVSTVAANLLQGVSASGDGSVNIGGTIAIGTATTATMGQFQIINGSWFRIL
jgi:hypothetical protein